MSYNNALNFETSRGLQNLLQEWCVGVSALPSEKVRPRWQPNPPPRPLIDEPWLAFGITSIEQSNAPYQEESPDGAAPATLQWVETLRLLLSFYGPDAAMQAVTFRNTAYIEENRYPLSRQNIRLQGFGEVTQLPEQVNELWYMRADLPMTLERSTVRVYSKTQAIGVTTSLHASVNGSVTVNIGVTPNAQP